MSHEKRHNEESLVVKNGIAYQRNNKSGLIKYTGEYQWVLEDGIVICYYNEGICKIRKVFNKSNLLMSETIFHSNSEKQVAIYDSSGKLKLRHSMKNDKLDGLSEIYENGKLLIKAIYLNGIQNGESILFNQNGEIITRSYYVNGIKQI
ncbi:toxin-antitoxin system YwqK family antitoxin [Sphingobacterium spiritivorum]|uniref:toxin-antitoxin system YwqK family antitoxin n=1 Tax=Sphingobacterium spiritivorum TaxID=258 RepID=UPI003DA66D86